MATEETEWSEERAAMLRQLRAYRISDERVMAAMANVRRHAYIPDSHHTSNPYADCPLPIGHAQTISQPYIVAYMTECLGLRGGERVLEIGTGSGYQSAVLAELGATVFSVELVPELSVHAQATLGAEGYHDVQILTADGHEGWKENAPYDVIVVTCAPRTAPRALVDQLKEGGRMIIPIGTVSQRLVIMRKIDGAAKESNDLRVRFVPMVHGTD